MKIAQIIQNGFKTGGVLAITTTAAILLASQRENGNSWAAMNCVAHIVDGDEKVQPTGYAPRESWMGLGINGVAMGAWGVLYEGALSVLSLRSTLLTAVIGTLAAYVTDYKIVPKQYTPGIEKRLSFPALCAIYSVLGMTLAVSGRWNTARREA